MSAETYEESAIRIMMRFAGLMDESVIIASGATIDKLVTSDRFDEFPIVERMVTEELIQAEIVKADSPPRDPNARIHSSFRIRKTTIKKILPKGMALLEPRLVWLRKETEGKTDFQLDIEAKNPRPENLKYRFAIDELNKRHLERVRLEKEEKEMQKVKEEQRDRQSARAEKFSLAAIMIALIAALGTLLQAYYAYLALPKPTASKVESTQPRLAQPESRSASVANQPVKTETPTPQAPATPPQQPQKQEPP